MFNIIMLLFLIKSENTMRNIYLSPVRQLLCILRFTPDPRVSAIGEVFSQSFVDDCTLGH